MLGNHDISRDSCLLKLFFFFWLKISYYSVTSFRIFGTAYIRRPWKWGTDSLEFFLPGASGRMGRFFTQVLFHNSVSFNAIT